MKGKDILSELEKEKISEDIKELKQKLLNIILIQKEDGANQTFKER